MPCWAYLSSTHIHPIAPKMHLQIIVAIFVALFAAGHSQTEPDCPRPVRCTANPCSVTTCPRYANMQNLECRADFCHGECRADFFRGETNVTARCPLETCRTKECPPRRMCVQEELPCQNTLSCIRRIRVQCVLPETPRPPADCSAISCLDGRRCEIVETKKGSEPKCVDFIPTSCTEVACDDGMQCEMRARARDDVMVARCVPQQKEETPSDCSQLECEEGLECVVMNGRAKCAKPPPPESCDELSCMRRYQCIVRGNEDDKEGNTRAVCVEEEPPTLPQQFDKQCNTMECQEGYECKMAELRDRKRQFVPRCIPTKCPVQTQPPRPRRPPQNCQELECGYNEECIVEFEREDDRREQHDSDNDRMRADRMDNRDDDRDCEETEDEEEVEGDEEEDSEPEMDDEEESEESSEESEESEQSGDSEESEESKESEKSKESKGSKEDEEERSGNRGGNRQGDGDREGQEEEDDDEEEENSNRGGNIQGGRGTEEEEDEKDRRGNRGGNRQGGRDREEKEEGEEEEQRRREQCRGERPRRRARCVPIRDPFLGSGSGSGCEWA